MDHLRGRAIAPSGRSVDVKARGGRVLDYIVDSKPASSGASRVRVARPASRPKGAVCCLWHSPRALARDGWHWLHTSGATRRERGRARANPGAALDRARFSDLVWTRARRSRRRGGRRDARSRVRSSRERFQKSAPSRTAVSWSSSFFPSATRRARLRPFVPSLPRPPISRADVASIPPAPSSRSRRVFTGRFSSGSRACSSSRRR